MYSSPIEIIYSDVQHRFEDGLFKAIQKVDIKVNKDELLKALAYDRNQYEKGYADAVADRIKGQWIEEPNCWYRCSHCGSHYPSIRKVMEYNFCPSCGAVMNETHW